MNNSNQTVLITGASSGFGKATAKLLSSQGFKLVLVSRDDEKLARLKKEIQTPAFITSLDVRSRSEVEKFFKTLPSEFADIDVLINNAGLAASADSASEALLDDWDTMIDTNIKGLLYMTRNVLDIMKQKNSGAIINLGSVAGLAAYRGGNVYGATKAFVAHFTRNLRADLLGTNIKVSNIAPGHADTNFSNVRFKGDLARAKKVYENTRALTAEDIAETILWIITRPAHVNIDEINIMPIDQTWGGLAVYRKE